MSIVDEQGNVVASYQYDPYGNVISATGPLAKINPLRYRGYYFDTEIGMYYLQSRYYDPELGRFINADSHASTGQGVLGNNMFAYCANNPINKADLGGNLWEWVAAIEIIIALLISGCASTASNDAVLVISSAEWEDSSHTMEEDMADALGTSDSHTALAANNSDFADCWNSATANYIIVHAHGSPTVITDTPRNLYFTIDDASQLSRNENVEFVLLATCSAGEPVENGYNMGQMLSTKISTDGYVICANKRLWGNNISLWPEEGGQWVVYQNGTLVASSIPKKVTLDDVVKYINRNLK